MHWRILPVWSIALTLVSTPACAAESQQTAANQEEFFLDLAFHTDSPPTMGWGDKHPLEVQLKRITARQHENYVAQFNAARDLASAQVSEARKSQLDSQIANANQQLANAKKDEFETTRDFEERFRSLRLRHSALSDERRILTSMLPEGVFEKRCAELRSQITSSVKLRLPVDEVRYDADNRKMTCEPSSDDVHRYPFVYDQTYGKDGYHHISQAFADTIWNGRKRVTLVIENIPDVETAKELKAILTKPVDYKQDGNTFTASSNTSGLFVAGSASITESTLPESTWHIPPRKTRIRSYTISFSGPLVFSVPDLPAFDSKGIVVHVIAR